MGFLSTTFRQSFRASLNDPRFTLNDAAAYDIMGGSKNDAGLPINREIALTYSPWWRGINLVSNDVAKIPLVVYRRVNSVDGEGKEKAADHQAYSLLRRKPNDRQTDYQFKKLLIVHAMSEGNGYAYIRRDGFASPVELLPLDPFVTHPVLANGKLWYVTKAGDEDRKIPAEDMLHIQGMGYDGLQGYPVWQKAKESLGLGMGAKKYATVVLKNNGRPSVILEHPGKLQEATANRLRTDWDRMHSGIDNAGKTAVLDQGMKAHAISVNPEDAQMISLMEWSIRDIANFIGVPPHKIGDTSRTAYSSLEQENQSYLDESLDPWLVNFEDQCWDKLLTEEEKADDSIIVEFMRLAMLRADMSAKANYYRTALAGQPWMKVNEVRARDNMNPVEGGDEIKAPLNMGGPGGPPQPPAEPPGSPEDDKPAKPPAKEPPKKPDKTKAMRAACSLAITDVVGRMVRRIGTHAERAAAKGGAAFCEWVDSFEGEHHDVVCESCKPVEAMAAALSDVAKEGAIAGWLMSTLRVAWGKVADKATAATLVTTVQALSAWQAANLPGAAAKIFAAEQERDEQGRFAGDGVDQATQDERDDEDKGIEKERNKEDSQDEVARGEEDEQVETAREKEDAQIEKASEKEDAASEKEFQKMDEAHDKASDQRDKETWKTEEQRDKEDEKIESQREKEEAQITREEEKEDAKLERQDAKEDKASGDRQSKEDDALTATHAKEVEDQDERHANEDVPQEQIDSENAELEQRRSGEQDAMSERHSAEDKAVEEKREAEQKELEDKRVGEHSGRQDRNEKEDAERTAKRETDDKERETRHQEEQAKEEQEKEAFRQRETQREQLREREDKAREAKRESEDKSRQEERDRQDERVLAERKAADEAREAKREKEDEQKAA